ncbi:MAG: flippase-like domain-containing protein [Flavobacteriales bacterium]|nr:flippase-like domain-containing protein [Flavobacteriales bacterium]
MNSNFRKTAVYLIFLALAAVLMWFLYKDISWENDLKPSLQRVNWWWILISFLIGYSATVIRGLRWNLMLEPMGFKAHNWTSIHSVAFGYCMNNLVPRSGELARCTLLNRAEKIPVNKLIGTVILERIVDVLLLAALMLAAFILKADALSNLFTQVDAGKGKLILYILVAGILGLVFFMIALKYLSHIPFISKVRHFFTGIGEGIKTIYQLRQQGLFWLYSIGIWGAWLLMTFCSMQALQETQHMTLSDTVFFMAAGSLGMLVPTPGGAGAFHGMAVLGFEALGYDGAVGRIYALISWSVKTTFDILIGAVGFFIVTSRKIKI